VHTQTDTQIDNVRF
jgi:hypothetical protein